MCLTVGFAVESFAVLATDTLVYTSLYRDGEPEELLSSREFPGGKLREGRNGSWMTVAGGQWGHDAFGAEPFPDFGDVAATRRWIDAVSVPGKDYGLPSYVTAIFERGGVFHVRSWHESGEIKVDSTTDRLPGSASMAAIYPTGFEEEELKAQLNDSFIEDVRRALQTPTPESIIGTVVTLFARTWRHTEVLGPTVDGVLLAASDQPGTFGALRFKRDVTTREEV